MEFFYFFLVYFFRLAPVGASLPVKMKDCRIVVRSFRKGDSKDRKKISSGAKKCSSDAKKCNSKGRNVAMNARKTFRSEETLVRKTVRIVGRIFRKIAIFEGFYK